jgi:hypothetical protein
MDVQKRREEEESPSDDEGEAFIDDEAQVLADLSGEGEGVVS